MTDIIEEESPYSKREKDQQRKDILLFALCREDSLVNNRLIWVLTIQGFLFAAVALSFEKGIEQKIYLLIISIVGVAISVMGAFLSVLANIHINKLKSQWGGIKTIVKDVSPFWFWSASSRVFYKSNRAKFLIACVYRHSLGCCFT